MADLKKKSIPLFTHWARPSWTRTYDYNYQVSESYYRPMVRYISTTRALAATSSSSSSSYQYETRRSRLERRRRAATPPRAMSFIERWSYEPFYGYSIGFIPRSSRATSEQVSSSSRYERDTSMNYSVRSAIETSRAQSRAQSVARSSRARSVSREQSVARSMQQQESSYLSSMDTRSRRAQSIDIAARYASDDCLMRSNALDSAALSARAQSIARDIAASTRAESVARDMTRAQSATRDIMNTSSLTSKTLALDNRNVLHGRTLDERYYLDYPKQHLVCTENCPLHNCPEWRRRFLIGNRFLDAAALGGFDVLYDPTVSTNSRRLLSKLAECSEYETDELSYQRSYDSEASRRRIRATASMA